MNFNHPYFFRIMLFGLLLFYGSAGAQQDVSLPGLVVEQNSLYLSGKVKHIEGVFLYTQGATPTRSDAKGRFTLVFADRPAGNLAQISAQKAGYKVVNERELESAAIIGRSSPLKVVLCDENRLRENRLAYYRIAEDIATREMTRKLGLLRTESKEKSRLIASLESSLQRSIKSEQEAISALEEMRMVQQIQGIQAADRLLLLNLDETSAIFRKAYEAFQQQDLDRAISLLDGIDSAARLANLSAAIDENRKAVAVLNTSIAAKEEQKRQELEQLVFKARLHLFKLDFDESEKTYALALKYDSTNVDLLWELAEFNANLNRFDKALNFVNYALQLPASVRQQAGLLNIAGVMFMKLNKPEEGEKALQKALEITLELAKGDSLRHLPELAFIQENLGHIQFRNNHLMKAGDYYEKSLLIWKYLEDTHPQIAIPLAASTLNHLGLVYKKFGQLPQADTLFRQSLHLYRRLEETTKGRYESEMAITIENLGTMYVEMGRPAAAEIWLKEVLTIRRKLCERNPARQLPELAGTLQSLGLLYLKYKDYAKAETQLRESLDIFERLEQSYPGAYLPDLANTLNILGVVFAEAGNYEKALTCYTPALNMRRKLADENPLASEVDLWTTYLNFAVLYKSMLLETLDMQYRRKGIDIIAELEMRIEIFDASNDKTQLTGRIHNDVHYFRDFFENATPSSLLVTRVLDTAEELELAAGKQPTPAAAAQKQAVVVETLVKAMRDLPGNQEITTRLAQSYGGLATYHLLSGNFMEARLAAENGLAADHREAWINIPLAPALLYLGEFEKAAAIYRTWHDAPYYGESTFRDLFLRDLDKLETLGFYHPDTGKIRALLK